MFILAQFVSAIALIFAVVSVQIKEKQKVVFLIALSNLFYFISFILLEAYLGSIVMLIATIRMFVLYYYSKKHDKQSLLLLFSLEILTLIGIIIMWEGPVSILLALGLLLNTYGFWQKNINILRYTLIFIGICYIVYNLMHYGYVNIILELTMIISTIISLIRFNKEKLSKKVL